MVTRARKLQPKTSSVTLLVRGVNDSTTSQAYPNAYVKPVETRSGLLDEKGAANAETTIALYQEGETHAPKVDDKITDADGYEWLIVKLSTRLNFRPNWGIHDCTARRTV